MDHQHKIQVYNERLGVLREQYRTLERLLEKVDIRDVPWEWDQEMRDQFGEIRWCFRHPMIFGNVMGIKYHILCIKEVEGILLYSKWATCCYVTDSSDDEHEAGEDALDEAGDEALDEEGDEALDEAGDEALDEAGDEALDEAGHDVAQLRPRDENNSSIPSISS